MSPSLLTKVKAKVDLPTARKVQGLIAGRGRSTFKGHGEDFDDLKYYQPGDRISDIDWKATARSGEPLIRQFNEERVRNICLVVDTSSAMAATAADGTLKRDALVTAAGLICYVAQRHGDLVSLVAGASGEPRQLPSRSSRGHLELLLRTLDTSVSVTGPQSSFEWALGRAFRSIARPSIMVLITDSMHPMGNEVHHIKRLTARHDVLVVRIDDADPLGRDIDSDVIDVNYPVELLAHTRKSAAVQKETDAYRARVRHQTHEALESLGVPHVLSAGDTRIVDDIVDMLRREEGTRGRR